jgi:hypothetical protein
MRGSVSCIVAFALCGVLLSCVVWFHEYAQIVGPPLSRGGAYRLRIQKVTHKPEFNPHALAIANSFCDVDIKLPHYPSRVESFDVRNLHLSAPDCPEYAKPLKSGTLNVEKTERRVTLRFTTESGPSPLNGSYPLHRDSEF